MLARELVGTYLDRHFPLRSAPRVQWADAKAVLDLVWPLTRDFEGFRRLVEDTAFTAAFDETADRVLRRMAIEGTMSPIGDADAGSQRVLLDRFDWSMSALVLEMMGKGEFKIPLPQDAPEHVRRFAALLAVLGEFGRNPPLEWRRVSERESGPTFPGTSRPRRQ